MFENLIEKKVSELKDLASVYTGRVDLAGFYSDEKMPVFTRQYFKAESEWQLYEENLRRISTKYFDLKDFASSGLFHEINSYYRKRACFSKEDFRRLLYSSERLRVNYITRPVNTMLEFIFRGEPTKVAEEIRLRLGYFTGYEYLKNQIDKKIEERYTDDFLVTERDFRVLAEDADYEYISGLDTSEFIELAWPLFTEINDDSGKTPYQALLLFLDDKKLFRVADKLDKLSSEGRVNYNENEFAQFLDSFARSDEFTGEPSFDPSISGDEKGIQSENHTSDLPDEEIDAPDAEMDDEQEFETGDKQGEVDDYLEKIHDLTNEFSDDETETGEAENYKPGTEAGEVDLTEELSEEFDNIDSEEGLENVIVNLKSKIGELDLEVAEDESEPDFERDYSDEERFNPDKSGFDLKYAAGKLAKETLQNPDDK